jgi:hypothetical protein
MSMMVYSLNCKTYIDMLESSETTETERAAYEAIEDKCVVFSSCTKDGHYRDEHSGECLACDHTCRDCVSSGFAYCTECPTGTHLETWNFSVVYGICRCDKAEHYYDSVAGSCQPCGPGCINCMSGETCLRCNDFADIGSDRTCVCKDASASLSNDCIPDVSICPQNCS